MNNIKEALAEIESHATIVYDFVPVVTLEVVRNVLGRYLEPFIQDEFGPNPSLQKFRTIKGELVDKFEFKDTGEQSKEFGKFNPSEPEYELLKDYEDPSGRVLKGVVKTESQWITRFALLNHGDCKIKTDWFREKKDSEEQTGNLTNVYAMLHEFRNLNQDFDSYFYLHPKNIDEFATMLSKKYTVTKK